MPLSTSIPLEERRARQREYARRSYQKHRAKNIERSKTWNKLNSERKKINNCRWSENNPDKLRECRHKAWRQKMDKKPDLVRAQGRAAWARWRAKDPDRVRELQRAWRVANRPALNAQMARARARRKKAMPRWLTKAQKAEIKALYVNARLLGCHVDHVAPLNGRGLCGLHVPWNLQLLTPHDNKRKYNNFIDRLSA
jgi:hypothetical protein